GQLNLAPEIALKRSSVKAGKGETVASVAKRYRLSPATVAEWNQVSVTANFKAGQAVVLYLPAGSKPAKQAAKSKTRAPSATKPSSRPKPSSKR
ncbi:MAG: LysM domain-containing protein, partial [Burkholderiales bacterium]|nr:LysM domain-containing protein [Burkholderiales bacterium]